MQALSAGFVQHGVKANFTIPQFVAGYVIAKDTYGFIRFPTPVTMIFIPPFEAGGIDERRSRLNIVKLKHAFDDLIEWHLPRGGNYSYLVSHFLLLFEA